MDKTELSLIQLTVERLLMSTYCKTVGSHSVAENVKRKDGSVVKIKVTRCGDETAIDVRNGEGKES